MKYFNREKIEFAKRVANGESVEAVANSADVTPGIVHQWISYYRAGMFDGREHLKTIEYTHNKKKPFITPKRVNHIANEYMRDTRNQARVVEPSFPEITPTNLSTIAELTRRVAMLEKVVLR